MVWRWRYAWEERYGSSERATISVARAGTFWRRRWSGARMSCQLRWPVQSLLAYLALHSGVRQSRARLAYLIWPDSTEAQAHTNLRNLIFKLRQALPASDTLLQADRNTLLWQGEGVCMLDVLEFERALAQAEAATEWDAQRQAWERAIELYRGDLLPGCYDEWILAERERLQQVMLYALERLIALYEQDQDYARALRTAQRLLHNDPLREDTYRCLMRLHAKRGDRSAMVRTYQSCTSILKRELGIGPGKLTQQTFEHLMQEDQS